MNSYERELGFNPLQFLMDRLERQETVSWLDLCCGSGRALIESANVLSQRGAGDRVTLVGVDLVGMFDPYPQDYPFLRLQEASAARWQPDQPFDLITCVHGLHYIGDKLRLIERAVSWLEKEGRFFAHLDFANLKGIDEAIPDRRFRKALRDQGIEYNRSKYLLSCEGQRQIYFGLSYCGADDQAGPNYTGQPVVNSYYSR